MKRLATLFTCSYGEFRSTRTITTAAMLGAVSVVLGYFSVQLGGYIRISFSTIANQLVYYLFGPVFGCSVNKRAALENYKAESFQQRCAAALIRQLAERFRRRQRNESFNQYQYQ